MEMNKNFAKIGDLNRQPKKGLMIQLPVNDYKSLPIPGIANARMGTCYVRVIDVPGVLDQYMEINPRVPSRTKSNLLSGPVVKGIMDTLRDHPEEMSLKNQGIYILVESADMIQKSKESGLRLMLLDKNKHGIINGGHTYAAIREAVENSSPEEFEALKNAYVQLHIFQGIDKNMVADIAEGLNRSKQVDDLSLANLQGEFDHIRKVLKDTTGGDKIAYHQGDAGSMYISEVLVYMYLFDKKRFNDRGPNVLYNRQSLGLKYFKEDMESDKKNLDKLITKLPDFLRLADTIRKLTPKAAKANGFKFGMTKIGNIRAAAAGTELAFLGETMDYRIPNGWVYPMLSAFRANLRETSKGLEWTVPLDIIVPDVINSLVGVCISEHKQNGLRPDAIGKRESAYSQCYTKVQLYLARKNLLST